MVSSTNSPWLSLFIHGLCLTHGCLFVATYISQDEEPEIETKGHGS